jgi:hypothetical protein
MKPADLPALPLTTVCLRTRSAATAFFCQRLKKSSELDYTDLLATWWAVLNSLCAVLSGMKREETVARSRLMHRPESSFLLADCELQWSCSIISMFLGRNIEAAHGKLCW